MNDTFRFVVDEGKSCRRLTTAKQANKVILQIAEQLNLFLLLGKEADL